MKVAVIGCGVMGAATARALAMRGNEVTIYERFEIGHRRGSSHGATRVYRYSYPDPTYVGMMKEAMGLWRGLESEAGTEILHQTGGLDTGKDLDAHAQALDAHDIPYELIDGAVATQRWPALALPDDEVLFQGDGGYVRAETAWKAFVDGATARGARLLEGRAIDELGPEGMSGHDITVVTAGGWARDLLTTAGIQLDVKPTRETVAYFRTHAECPTLVDWGDPSVYALPDPVYGLKVGEHIAGPETDPDEVGVVDPDSVERLRAWVVARYPGIKPEPAHAETCIYSNTPDEHFVLERHSNVVVGSACSGHGFKFAPLIGHLLADLVES
jgi:sarcosine oxidase